MLNSSQLFTIGMWLTPTLATECQVQNTVTTGRPLVDVTIFTIILKDIHSDGWCALFYIKIFDNEGMCCTRASFLLVALRIFCSQLSFSVSSPDEVVDGIKRSYFISSLVIQCSRNALNANDGNVGWWLDWFCALWLACWQPLPVPYRPLNWEGFTAEVKIIPATTMDPTTLKVNVSILTLYIQLH